jgi:VWFA-related protein
MFRFRRLFSSAAVLVFASSAAAWAQQGLPAPTPAAQAAGQTLSPNISTDQPATQLRVNTRLVSVDVVATDNKGIPITDLKAEDFTVQEEGRDQPVRVFSFHQPDQPAASDTVAAAAPAHKLPEGYFSNTPRYKTNGALNVILLDTMNSSLPNQAFMRDAMIKFLEKMPAGQPVAIYLMGNKLTLIQDFTSDPELLHKAIASLKRQGSKTMDNAAGTARMEDMPVGSVASYAMMDIPQLAVALENFRDQKTASDAESRVRFSLDVLNSLARSLAGYPGRKNLVWISETFPFAIVVDKITTMSDRVFSGTVETEAANANNGRDFSHEIALTGSLLSNAQVAIYPVDAGALGGNADFSVGNDPTPLGKPAVVATTLYADAGKNMNREAEGHLASHGTMNDLADKTGGKAFYNTNNLEGAVRKSLEDGSTYYTLGYYPENKGWDGKFRHITVKAARPGVKLHYRIGYFATEPQAYTKLDQARKNDDLAKAMSLNFPISTSLLFQAAVMPPSAESKNKVLINYAVDPHALTFELGGDGLQHASVDCAVIVYSPKGEAVQALSNTMIAALKPEEYKRVMQKSFPCRQSVELAPGEYLFRLGVRDARTGLVGTLNAPVTVAPPAANSNTQPVEKKQ